MTKAVLLLFASVAAYAAQPGAGTQRTHQAPDGTVERCTSGVRVPGGRYSADDESTEARYCVIDFYSSSVALCPKTWSTSPATIVYDVAGGRFPNDPAAFERDACPKGGAARRDARAELAMFKMSMNERDTSGTYSPSSLLYYHLSRYFETLVQVPVAVARTIDKKAHDRRVIEPGLRYTAGKSQLKQVHAGWRHYADAAGGAGPEQITREFLTPDGKQLYGVLLNETGTRYGIRVNGTRTGGWGAGQNVAFQKTPPFQALRQAQPLPNAIQEGVRLARRDPAMARAMSAGLSDAQMVFWMRELTEIVLLDFILGQQDRVGNIDYVDHWYWVKEGQVGHRPATEAKSPADLAPLNPLRIRRTWLNDNDAGVRRSYADFAQQTHMLDGMAHFSAGVYRKLMRLDRDLQAQGELYRHLAGGYGLGAAELGLIVRRTNEAAGILRRACREGRLRFDLEPESFLRGSAHEATPGCEAKEP